ncbi:MAG: hypothetical protein WCO33_04770, partial [bacterium]
MLSGKKKIKKGICLICCGKQELQDLQKNFKEKEETLAQLKKQLQEKEDAFKAIDSENKKMIKQITESDKQMETLKQKIQKMENKKKSGDAANKKVDMEEFENATKEIGELQAQIKKLKSEADEKAEAVEQAIRDPGGDHRR